MLDSIGVMEFCDRLLLRSHWAVGLDYQVLRRVGDDALWHRLHGVMLASVSGINIHQAWGVDPRGLLFVWDSSGDPQQRYSMNICL